MGPAVGERVTDAGRVTNEPPSKVTAVIAKALPMMVDPLLKVIAV